MVSEATVRSFLAVARVGSITEAARQLYLSQQAVSKHVARLEEDLGCPLFVRERGSMTLSEYGEIYFDAFSRMESALRDARLQADGLMDRRESTLAIGHLDLLDMARYFREISQGFQAQNPNVSLCFRSAPDWGALDWLLREQVDAAFTFATELEGYDELSCVHIRYLQELLVVSSEYPGAKSAGSYLDFRDEPVFCTPAPHDDAGRERMAARMKLLGFSADHMAEVDNILTACSNVELGRGVMFLTETCHLLDRADFLTFPTGQRADLVLAYRKNTRKRAVRRFVDFISRTQIK